MFVGAVRVRVPVMMLSCDRLESISYLALGVSSSSLSCESIVSVSLSDDELDELVGSGSGSGSGGGGSGWISFGFWGVELEAPSFGAGGGVGVGGCSSAPSFCGKGGESSGGKLISKSGLGGSGSASGGNWVLDVLETLRECLVFVLVERV